MSKTKRKLMDTGKLAIASWINFGFFMLSGIVATSCVDISHTIDEHSLSHKFFQFGFNLGGFTLIPFTLLCSLLFFVLSIIALIKNKKVFPYLIFPIPSIIMWIYVMMTMVVYV